MSTVDPHSTKHARGNDPDIDDPIDTDPRAHSHSDDTRNLGSITITVESDKDNHDNHEHKDGETGSLKIIDGHRHGVDKTHSHNDDGHVDTSEDGHQTHPLGKSSHSHTTSGTAIAEHSHSGMTVDKQNHEHSTDAGGEARTADAHTHAADTDVVEGGDANPHTHTNYKNSKIDTADLSITDVASHTHAISSTKDKDGDVLNHEHDGDGVVGGGINADRGLMAHDHDATDPVGGQEHTHDKAPDGTVAKVDSHKHTGDPLGVKMDHEHGTDEAVVVVGTLSRP